MSDVNNNYGQGYDRTPNVYGNPYNLDAGAEPITELFEDDNAYSVTPVTEGPYQLTPYSGNPYSLTPNSGNPYSLTPNSGNPYSLTPNSGGAPQGRPRSGSGVAPPPVNRTPPPEYVKEQANVVTTSSGSLRIMQNMGSGHLASDQRHGVKYFSTDAERAKYRVTIQSSMTRRGEVFDTKAIATHLKNTPGMKAREAAYAADRSQIKGTLGHANLGNHRTPADWYNDALIWVCAPDASDKAAFYSHACKIHKFHHSSFQAGGGVIAAGEWIVVGGKLKKFSGNSGHYTTQMDAFYRGVLHMAPAFQPDTTVFLYEVATNTWIDYPVKDFIRAPTRGGQLKVHPRA